MRRSSHWLVALGCTGCLLAGAASATGDGFGELPPGAIVTRQFSDATGELSVEFPIAPAAAATWLPKGFTFRTYSQAAANGYEEAKRMIAAHPEIADQARGRFAFFGLRDVSVGTKHWANVNLAFFWMAVSSDIADPRLKGSQWLQVAEWTGDDAARRELADFAGNAGPATVTLTTNGKDKCEGHLRAEGLDISMEGVLAGESSVMDYGQLAARGSSPAGTKAATEKSDAAVQQPPQYQTLWVVAEDSPRLIVNTYSGHWEQSCTPQWRVQGESLLAAQLRAAIRDQTARSPRGFLTRWSAKQSLYAPIVAESRK